MTRKEIHDYCLSLPTTHLDYPFGEDVAVYKTAVSSEHKMFALLTENTDPLRLSLKCDPQLARILRDRYESVLEGYHLNKKHWNTVLLTGQLTDQEIYDLILHSYNLVARNTDITPKFDR